MRIATSIVVSYIVEMDVRWVREICERENEYFGYCYNMKVELHADKIMYIE